MKTSIRGLCAVDEKVCWFGTDEGTIGRTINGGKTWERFVIKGAEKLDFRDVEAVDAKRCVAMSVGEGEASRIYQTLDGGESWKLIHQNKAPMATTGWPFGMRRMVSLPVIRLEGGWSFSGRLMEEQPGKVF